MLHDRNISSADNAPAPQIDALLCMTECMSIFDRLMALPRMAESDRETEWDRAVASRIQSKVSGLMKEHLGDNEPRRKAA